MRKIIYYIGHCGYSIGIGAFTTDSRQQTILGKMISDTDNSYEFHSSSILLTPLSNVSENTLHNSNI